MIHETKKIEIVHYHLLMMTISYYITSVFNSVIS